MCAQALPESWINAETVWHVNPTGKFVIGGPDGDCGLTGRKIIVDTYGGAAPHGGGAFSGKDPTKVDRSAAYAARYLAKNVVAGGFADRCTIQLSYAIGVAKPLSIYVDLHDTGKVEPRDLERCADRGDGPLAARHPRASEAQPADLWTHRPPTAISAAQPEDDGGFSWERVDLIEAIDAALVTSPPCRRRRRLVLRPAQGKDA